MFPKVLKTLTEVHLDEPEDGGDHENDAEDELQDRDYGVCICEFKFVVEDLELLAYCVVFGLEDVDSSVDFSFAAKSLKASGFFIVFYCVVIFLKLLTFLDELLQDSCQLTPYFQHLFRLSSSGPQSEFIDHIER